jgi:hypothetical protein
MTRFHHSNGRDFVLKKILQASAIASLFAIGFVLPASAASEEDMAAPLGSFTADMRAPVNPRVAAFLARHPDFARHMRERMMRRAELDRPATVR